MNKSASADVPYIPDLKDGVFFLLLDKDIIIEKLENVDIDKDFVLIADYIFNKYENI